MFVTKNGHFLEKEFLAKEVSEMTVQLDEIMKSPEVRTSEIDLFQKLLTQLNQKILHQL